MRKPPATATPFAYGTARLSSTLPKGIYTGVEFVVIVIGNNKYKATRNHPREYTL